MRLIPRCRMLLRSSALLLALLIALPAMKASAFPLRFTSVRTAVLGLEVNDSEAEVPLSAIALSLEDLAAMEAENETYIPHVWPVRFSKDGRITSPFGPRLDPFTGEETEYHAGVDLADRLNSKIYAAASGVVVEVKTTDGYGLTVKIDHGNGYSTRYSHCNSVLVQEGDEVTQGQIIALMGKTGRATGVHLDFRVFLDEQAIDPMLVLDEVTD